MRRIVSVLAVFILAMGCQQSAFAQSRSGDIEIDDAWVRVLPKSPDEASVFLQILNHGEVPDSLVDVSTDAAGDAGLKQAGFRNTKPFVDSVREIRVLPTRRVRLLPGGYYIALANLRAPLEVGKVITLTLKFEHAGHIDVQAKVSNQLLGNRR